MIMFEKVRTALAGKKKYILAVLVGVYATAEALGYGVPQAVKDVVIQVLTALLGA